VSETCIQKDYDDDILIYNIFNNCKQQNTKLTEVGFDPLTICPQAQHVNPSSELHFVGL
jgi:phage terminase large subunit-like protein